MKTILALWHTEKKGKTETLRAVAEELLTRYPNNEIFCSSYEPNATGQDFKLVISVNGKKVGIVSKGDPETELKEKLTKFVQIHQCDVIICATRTKGQTFYAVDSVWSNEDYDIIWTSTYQVDEEKLQKKANTIKAKHIIDLLESLDRL